MTSPHVQTGKERPHRFTSFIVFKGTTTSSLLRTTQNRVTSSGHRKAEDNDPNDIHVNLYRVCKLQLLKYDIKKNIK